MNDYSRATVRDYFAGLTPDSRPCKMDRCPIQTALDLEFLADATRLDSALANAIDRETYKAHKPQMGYQFLTAGEIVAIIDRVNADEGRMIAESGEPS